MAIPGAGWSIIWGPAGDYAYVTAPDGSIIYRWFGDNNEQSNITLAELENTQGIIDQANQPSGGGGGITEELGGGYTVTHPRTGIQLTLETWAEAESQFYAWQEEMAEQDEAEALAQQEAWREEDRAYNEQQLAESLARQLAAQHGRQQESWGYAAANAPGAGAGILASLLPAYLPESVAGSLYGYGKRIGTEFDPAWPGGTALGEAQMTPTGQDWIEYLKQQGYPSYLWER